MLHWSIYFQTDPYSGCWPQITSIWLSLKHSLFKAQLSVDTGLIHCKTQDASIWKQANTIPFTCYGTEVHIAICLWFVFIVVFFLLTCKIWWNIWGNDFRVKRHCDDFNRKISDCLWGLIEYELIMALYSEYMFVHTTSLKLGLIIRGFRNWGAICRLILTEGWTPIIHRAHIQWMCAVPHALMYCTKPKRTKIWKKNVISCISGE